MKKSKRCQSMAFALFSINLKCEISKKNKHKFDILFNEHCTHDKDVIEWKKSTREKGNAMKGNWNMGKRTHFDRTDTNTLIFDELGLEFLLLRRRNDMCFLNSYSTHFKPIEKIYAVMIHHLNVILFRFHIFFLDCFICQWRYKIRYLRFHN